MKGLIEKLAHWGSKLMNHGNYEQQIKNSICNTIIDNLKKRKSCRCNLFIFYDEEKRKKLLQQIMSKKDIKLTEWEVLTVINETANHIQKNNGVAYPIKNATDTQIEEFANKLSLRVANYISSQHSNTVFLPIKGLPEQTRNFLTNKALPNIKFTAQNDHIHINLAVNGPLVYGSHNAEMISLNNLLQTILTVGILFDFFNTSPLQDSALNLKESAFEKTENYTSINNLFFTETESLAENISIHPDANDNVEKYFTALNKILNDTSNAPAIMYSLTWYCKSLNLGDIKTIFICRYIGFEALSGVWTKSNKKDKSSQDKVKYTISALLAKDINNLKEKQVQLKKIIDLRNELFHGDKNECDTEELGRNMHRQYFNLGLIYKELFLHTVNKI
jgi:hypothetical protein